MATIMVVEDEAANAEILNRLLLRWGHEVIIASNKKMAIEIAIAQPVDLVLMDMGIPDEEGGRYNDNGGLEATKVLRSTPETATIPVIATTAFSMLDERRKFEEAGCNDVQPKPLDFPNLKASIEKCLAESYEDAPRSPRN